MSISKVDRYTTKTLVPTTRLVECDSLIFGCGDTIRVGDQSDRSS
ncbi:hypothetical protein [Floridanema aerugineum]|uniref:Uncharacterized protein n=1 Tax=Floridaenema aerugineum BLCC-F46 TaxID=3153654 RepID=A0ABV4X702_9CYAN